MDKKFGWVLADNQFMLLGIKQLQALFYILQPNAGSFPLRVVILFGVQAVVYIQL
jgi:hypothetical protein